MEKKTFTVLMVLVSFFVLFQTPALAKYFPVSTTSELQDALTASAFNGEDDTIYIGSGEYYGHQFMYSSGPSETYSLRIVGMGADKTFLGHGTNALLISEAYGRVTIENLTISECDSIIGGLSYSGNSDLTVMNCSFISNSATGYDGGGLHALTTSGTVTIQGSLFDGNSALRGGGMFVSAPNVVLEGNNIINNRLAVEGTGIQVGSGAGVHVDGGGGGANITIRNNLFSGNGVYATNIAGKGAGLYINGWMMNSVLLERNLFDQNTLQGDGGGAYISGIDGPMQGIMLNSNRFNENTSGTDTGAGTGGGVYVYCAGSMAGPITAVNNVFARNTGGAAGGAYVSNLDRPVIFTNNTSYDNQSNSGGDVTVQLGPTAHADIYNNILWDADDGQDLAVLGTGTANVCSNDINKTISDFVLNNCGSSNINGNPYLIEYHISDAWTAVTDSGNNAAPGIPSEDIDGEARIIGTAVDMGADEYNPEIPSAWQEVAQLSILEGNYGYSVDVHKDTLVVGSPLGGGDESGVVYVYRRSTDNPHDWIQEQVLTIAINSSIYDTVGAHFGYSVAIEGDTLVVGAPDLLNDISNQNVRTGAIFIYERGGPEDDEAWELRKIFFGVYGIDEYSQGLGTSVAISGDTIVAGASGTELSAAYVYVKNLSGYWSHTQVLLPYGLNPDFASSVSIWDYLIAVGAPETLEQGSVFTFKREYGAFQIANQLSPSRENSTDHYFGQNVAISKNVLAVSQITKGGVYKLATGVTNFWDEVNWFDVAGYQPGGRYMDINGPWFVTGDQSHGLVTVFYKYFAATPENSEPWTRVQDIYCPPHAFETVEFGWATAIDDATLVVGDPKNHRVYIYEFPHPTFESPNEYTESETQYGIISQSEMQDFEFDNPSLQDIQGKVAFGSTFRLEVFDPSGLPYGDPVESSASPITVEIPGAAVGTWTFRITAVQSVPDNHFTFAVLVRDTDNDGIPDISDNCPTVANPDQADSDGDGIGDACETMADADSDGIPDDQDNCPATYNPGQENADGDSAGDACDGCPADSLKINPGICGCGVADLDTDGDGVADCVDGCPADPAKTAPGMCGCGVPDVDTDGDGVADCVDGCPADPAKAAPGICGCGVADIDGDSDGTMDCVDACLTDPAKIDPGICGCGVADTDTDGDGVADCVDNCPAVDNPGQADSDGDGIGDACEQAASQPPLAICKDVTVVADNTCQASASIDNGSYDPDGDALTMQQTPVGPYSLGATTATLTVTDSTGLSATCQAIITVVDSTPPVISSFTVSPDLLWPPNHKMVSITPSVAASDNCGGALTIQLQTVTMNEGAETSTYDPDYDSTAGDGHTLDDIQVDGSGNISLRAERSGTGTGRIYTIIYAVTDASGNSSSANTTVTVPHSQ